MESQDYETNRNLTLMFFLEKLLVEKPTSYGQPPGGSQGYCRSLHDLSCQFGTKGFSKEMRQIAGGSQAGLKKFLLQYPSLFTVDGDTVSITQSSNGESSNRPGGTSSRDYTREAIDYFKARLKHYGPGTEVPIKSLLGHRSQAPPEVRHISGQHVKEFREFLAKFPDDFVVNVEDDIIYLKEYEGQIRHQCDPDQEVISEVKIDPKVTSKILSLVREILTEQNDKSMTVEQGFKMTTDHFDGEDQILPFKRSQDFDTFLKMHSHLFRVQGGTVTLVPIKNVSWTSNSGSQPAQEPPKPAAPKLSSNGVHQTLKQRVNSVVMKALADNSDRDRVKSSSLDPEPMTKDQILRSTRVIMTSKESHQVIDQIMRTSLNPVIAIDGEGINLGTKGQLTLFQIATMDKQAYVFDLISDPNLWTDGGLKRLLCSPNVVKVFHDCRNEAGVLHSQHDILLHNVFDTQAAHAVLELQEHGKPVYKVKNVSLSSLCEAYNVSSNPVKDQIKAFYRRDQRFWARRPLTMDMLCYAAADVLSLVPDIYQSMKSAMRPEFINLFGELCEEQVMLYIDPDAVKSKKKQRKIDFEISDLRLKLANTSSKTIVLSNREIRLLRHVELTESDKERLKGSYKVAKKLEKLESKSKQNDSDEDSDRDDDNKDEDDLNDNDLPSLESVISDGSSDYSLMSTTSPALRSPFGRNSGLSTSPGSTQPSSLQAPPLSLTDQMDLVNGILADQSLDRTERIDKLESILTDMTEAIAANKSPREKVSVATQTVSTGDINITKVYSEPK